MNFSPLVSQLIDSLRCLPGVGAKSAQRMALHLLERDRGGAQHLAKTLMKAVAEVKRCQRCRTLSETEVCSICNNHRRDASVLCIVETPIDLLAIEQSGSFSGYYFVLMGHLSPLDGIGPEELQLHQLAERLQTEGLEEVVLATNPTVEGEATAHYISDMVRAAGKRLSRIAYGVPFGGELEYIDSNTLSHAFNTRQALNGD